MVKSIAIDTFSRHHRFLSWSRHSFGLLPAVMGYARMVIGGELTSIRNKSLGRDVYFRPGTIDQAVYNEIFVNAEYDLDLGNPRFILDAGAHIGLSAVYLANRYPHATIVAVEPSPENFKVLCQNAESWPNIKPMNAGLWSHRAKLQIDDDAVESWGFTVSESRSGRGIDAYSVEDIMALFGAPRIDVLKMDIEGSEIEVLQDSANWLGSVGSLILELHDRLRPGCTAALGQALQSYRYHRSISGEKMVFTDLRPAT